MVEKLKGLLTVKSLVTLALTGVVCYLAVCGKFDIRDIYLMIVSFYFGTQTEKTKQALTVAESVEKEN